MLNKHFEALKIKLSQNNDFNIEEINKIVEYSAKPQEISQLNEDMAVIGLKSKNLVLGVLVNITSEDNFFIMVDISVSDERYILVEIQNNVPIRMVKISSKFIIS